jgi:hypothetical protein
MSFHPLEQPAPAPVPAQEATVSVWGDRLPEGLGRILIEDGATGRRRQGTRRRPAVVCDIGAKPDRFDMAFSEFPASHGVFSGPD